jgi:hypothetical protein
MLLEALRPLDAQQRHEQQRHPGGLQPVEGGAETAVVLAGDHENIAGDQGGQRKENAGARDSTARLEQGRGGVEEPEIRQEAIKPPVGRIGLERHRQIVWHGGRSGQVGVRPGHSVLCAGQAASRWLSQHYSVAY